jgi:membrane associated rhomboid family serine protease
MEDQWHIKSFIHKIRFPLAILCLLWGIEIYEVLFDKNFMYYGIYPREFGSLPYIFTAPFIHSDWNHLLSNSAPILVLMSIMAIFYPRVSTLSYLFILSGTGFMVWMFARGNSYHIGASGVVYGLVSFVFWTGLFRKNLKSVILALMMIILYSGLFQNIFPSEEKNISWESHLFGGIVGLVIAFIFKSVREPDEEEEKPSWSGDEERNYFLPRDAFEITKEERWLQEREGN